MINDVEQDQNVEQAEQEKADQSNANESLDAVAVVDETNKTDEKEQLGVEKVSADEHKVAVESVDQMTQTSDVQDLDSQSGLSQALGNENVINSQACTADDGKLPDTDSKDVSTLMQQLLHKLMAVERCTDMDQAMTALVCQLNDMHNAPSYRQMAFYDEKNETSITLQLDQQCCAQSEICRIMVMNRCASQMRQRWRRFIELLPSFLTLCGIPAMEATVCSQVLDCDNEPFKPMPVIAPIGPKALAKKASQREEEKALQSNVSKVDATSLELPTVSEPTDELGDTVNVPNTDHDDDADEDDSSSSSLLSRKEQRLKNRSKRSRQQKLRENPKKEAVRNPKAVPRHMRITSDDGATSHSNTDSVDSEVEVLDDNDQKKSSRSVTAARKTSQTASKKKSKLVKKEPVNSTIDAISSRTRSARRKELKGTESGNISLRDDSSDEESAADPEPVSESKAEIEADSDEKIDKLLTTVKTEKIDEQDHSSNASDASEASDNDSENDSDNDSDVDDVGEDEPHWTTLKKPCDDIKLSDSAATFLDEVIEIIKGEKSVTDVGVGVKAQSKSTKKKKKKTDQPKYILSGTLSFAELAKVGTKGPRIKKKQIEELSKVWKAETKKLTSKKNRFINTMLIGMIHYIILRLFDAFDEKLLTYDTHTVDFNGLMVKLGKDTVYHSVPDYKTKDGNGTGPDYKSKHNVGIGPCLSWDLSRAICESQYLADNVGLVRKVGDFVAELCNHCFRDPAELSNNTGTHGTDLFAFFMNSSTMLKHVTFFGHQPNKYREQLLRKLKVQYDKDSASEMLQYYIMLSFQPSSLKIFLFETFLLILTA